jgi:exosortase/archaeosortase family protein
MSSLTLVVAETCSGLRFLISLMTIAIIYGYFKQTSARRKVWIAMTAILVAIGANGLRIMGSGVIGQYWGPAKAEGFFVVVFAISFLLLVLLHTALGWTAGFLRFGRTT